MKLTKEQIEDIEVGGDDQEWEISIDMTMDDMRELRRLALLGLEREERMNEALSGEADAVRRAESAELGCEIAYRREPTQDEGDAHEDEPGECFVTMGGWTGRRCRVCNMWTWGGPTACVACAAREERDEARAEVATLIANADADSYTISRLGTELVEARAERDRRPDISAKDAAHAIKFFRGWDAPGSVTDRVFAALRAHAAKAVKP